MRYLCTVLVLLIGLTLLISIQAFSAAPATSIIIKAIASSSGSWSGGNPDVWTATATGAYVNKAEIESRLNAGTSVTLSASTDIIDLDGVAILKTAGGDATFKMAAGRHIYLSSKDTIASSVGKLHIIVDADANSDGDGGILVSSDNQYFASNGGDIVFGGGSDPYSSSAYGTSSGVDLSQITVSAGAGAIVIHGHGAGTNAAGVSVYEGCKLITTTGNITIAGIGGSSTSTSGSGVRVSTVATIQATSGTITITGTSGSGTGTASGNPGVYIASLSVISSTTGPVNIAGTCGDAFNGLSVGVWMGQDGGGVDPKIKTVDGAITITGTSTTKSSTSSAGFYGVSMESGASITATGLGTVSVTGTGGGGIYDNYGVMISNTSRVGGITTNTGAISILAAAGTGSSGGSSGLYVKGSGTGARSWISSTGGSITVTGTSAKGGSGINLEGDSVKITTGGDISLTAAANGSPGSNNGYGLYLRSHSKIQATGSGKITVDATTPTGGSTTNLGVYLEGGSGVSSCITTENGDLMLTAVSAGTNTGATNAGIYFGGENDTIGSSGTGKVTVSATANTTGYGFWVHGPSMCIISKQSKLNIMAAGAGSFAGIGFSTFTDGLAFLSYGSDSINVTGKSTGSGIGVLTSGASMIFGDASFTGPIVLEAGSASASDAISISNTTIFRGQGPLTVRPTSASNAISIIAGSTGTFNLTGLELSGIQSSISSVTIGRADGTAAFDVRAGTVSHPLVLLSSSGDIAFNGAFSTGSNSLTVTTTGNVTQSAAITAGSLTLNGSGSASISLGGQNNSVSSFDASGSTVAFRNDASFSIGSVSASDLTLSGNGTITASGSVSTLGLTLKGSGTYSLSGTARNLVLTTASLTLNGAFSTDSLSMGGGNIDASAFMLSIGTSPSSVVSVARTSGAVIGSMKRWFPASTGPAALFPVGDSINYRPATVTFSAAPTLPGSVTAHFHAEVPGDDGLPATDPYDSLHANTMLPSGYWSFVGSDGLDGGTYTMDLAATSFSGVTDYANVKMLTRVQPGYPWAFAGFPSAGTGSNAAPVAHRSAVSGFYDWGVSQSTDKAPEFTVTPASLSFGYVGSSEYRTADVVVKNTGTLDLSIDSVLSTYYMYSVTQGDTTLAPGDSATYTITFHAMAGGGTHTGTINFYHNATGSPTGVGVSAKVVTNSPYVQTTNITFSNVKKGSMTIHWTRGDGDHTIVVMKAGSAVDSLPADGSFYFPNTRFGHGDQVAPGIYTVAFTGSDSVTVTGLQPTTTYYVAACEGNGIFSQANFLTTSPATGSQATIAPDPSAQFALRFDGVDDYVVGFGGTYCIAPFTVEAWVKPEDSTGTIAIFGSRAPYDDGFDMKLMGGNKIHGDINDGFGDWLSTSADADFNYSTGVWYHIAYVVTSDSFIIYVDGNRVGGGAHDGPLYGATPLLGDGQHYLHVGQCGLGEYFKGNIDEVRVWGTARTQQEIREYMHCTLTGAPAGLVDYWNLDDGEGTMASSLIAGENITLNNFDMTASSGWVQATDPNGPGSAHSVFGATTGTQSLGNVQVALTEDFDGPTDLTATEITQAPSVLPTGTATILNSRYWIIRSYGNAGSFGSTVTFAVPSSFTNHGAATATLYTLYNRQPNAEGAWTPAGSATALTETTITFPNVSAFGQFAIGTDDPLPIQLMSFSGTSSAHGVVLQWGTATESNCLGFYVERRAANARVFTAVSGLIAGGGTTLEPREYAWTDTTATGSSYTYRLRQVDLDGATSYSMPIVISGVTSVVEEIPKEFGLLQNYPNPFNPTTTIRFDLPVESVVSVKVYNLLGQLVARPADGVVSAGQRSVSFDANMLASGLYYYRLEAASVTDPGKRFSAIRKMLLVR